MGFLAPIAGPLQILGTVLGAAGTVYSGIAAMQAANYQAAVAEMNAKIAEDNARRAVFASQVAAQDQDRQTAAALGELLAQQGASGIDVGTGSQLLAQRGTRELGRLDSLRIRQEGDIQRYNFQTDAVNARAQAQLSRMEGRSALIGGILGGARSLLGAASGISDRTRARIIGQPLPVPRPRGLLT